MKANEKLLALIIIAVISFCALIFFFFYEAPQSDTNNNNDNNNNNKKMKSIPLRGVPPTQSQNSNNNNNNNKKKNLGPGDGGEGIIADDPVDQFFDRAPALTECHKKHRQITKSELAEHTTENDLWVLIHGHVLNVTKFVHQHPGGVQMLMKGAGGNEDGAHLFATYHSPETVALFNGFCIGVLAGNDRDRGL